MRRAVRELRPLNRPATPRTFLPLSPIDVQGAPEVSGLSLHIHVEGIKTGSTSIECSHHDVLRRSQQADRFPLLQSPSPSRRTQLRSPQCFVSIDIPDARDEVLVQQRPLDFRAFCPHRPPNFLDVKPRLQWILRNVRDGSWYRRKLFVWISDKVHHLPAAEGALVNKVQFDGLGTTRWWLERCSDSHMRIRNCS